MYYYYNETTGKIYDNRYDAIADNINNSQSVKFYWRDDEFDKVDWKTEPKETLHELYKERAEQIRNDYDYVVLCYSGGIDSTNVLETFYYNNIHIDEIVSVGSFSQDESTEIDAYHNKEIYKNVKETLNGFHLPNTKKTFIDYTTHFTNINQFSLIQKYGADYYKYIGAYPSVTYLFWYDLGKFLNTKKKTAIIFAAEKPFIRSIPSLNKFYVNFADESIATYTNYIFDNTSRLNFYSDPEANKIARKQLHIIKDFYISKVMVEKSMTKEFFKCNYYDIAHALIYDIKNPLQYVAKKSSSMFLSNRDLYITKHKNSEVFKVYNDAIKMLSKKIPLDRRYAIRTKNYYLT